MFVQLMLPTGYPKVSKKRSAHSVQPFGQIQETYRQISTFTVKPSAILPHRNLDSHESMKNCINFKDYFSFKVSQHLGLWIFVPNLFIICVALDHADLADWSLSRQVQQQYSSSTPVVQQQYSSSTAVVQQQYTSSTPVVQQQYSSSTAFSCSLQNY